MPVYPVITGNTLEPVNEFPMTVPCPECKEVVVTRVDFSAGALTYLLVIVMMLFGLVCCAFIPCCVNSCKDAYHYCPNCQHFFGVYKRLRLDRTRLIVI
uniref:LITAF domain-containing protein n=1 Tax=Steinernema glaseri TaxID=37863 RepID=A0A1I7YKI0_9BILA